MAGNFRGVLIFVIDLAVTKFSTHENQWYEVHIIVDDGRSQNIMVARPTVLSVSKQQ